jgi:gas vesicle protein
MTKVSWLLAGATVGAAATILTAPQSGAKTRRMIRDKAEDGYKAASDVTHKCIDETTHMYDRGKQVVTEAVDSATERVKAIRG